MQGFAHAATATGDAARTRLAFTHIFIDRVIDTHQKQRTEV